MTGPVFFTEELSNSKVAAIYPDPAVARRDAQRVREALGLLDGQVDVLLPGQPRAARRLHPETRGIWRTLVWAHVRVGVIGAVLGLLAYLGLRIAGVEMVTQSPWLSWLLMTFYGLVGGLMVGGLVTLRPDQDRYTMKVLEALREGDSAVIVHAMSAEQKRQAQEILEDRSAETAATL